MATTNEANPHRGEVDFPVRNAGGDIERNYILKLSLNAGAALQKKFKGKPMGEIVAGLDKMDFDTIKELAFMLLQKHHADEVTTPDKAGDVVDDGGGIVKFAEAFKALLGVKDASEGNGNPQTAQTSTSGSSTSTPGASA